MQTAREGSPVIGGHYLSPVRACVRGIRVKGKARLKATDIFVPLAMLFGIKYTRFPCVMQTTAGP